MAGPSPAVVGAPRHHHAATVDDPWVLRRVGVIWGLLFFNCLGSLGPPGNLPIPRAATQMLTMGALGLALLLALSLNRRMLLRPTFVLVISTVTALLALMTGVRGTAGAGAVLRSGRFLVFVAVLWLLTPWWGRRDLLLARFHLRALMATSASVLLGLVLFPSSALPGGLSGRLSGVLWTIGPTQVAAYAAVMAGMATMAWMAGSLGRAPAGVLAAVGLGMVLMSRTRTALTGLVVGLVIATLTLFLDRKRVRRMALAGLLIAPALGIALAPALSSWFLRDQTSAQIGGLTGRKHVWEMATKAPRSEFNRWFGFGLSDKSFDGLAIDSTWIAVYQDEGLIGDLLVAVTLAGLLLIASRRRSGAERGIAVFLVVYCVVSSYTEVGIGDASVYLLHAVVAASLLAAVPHKARPQE